MKLNHRNRLLAALDPDFRKKFLEQVDRLITEMDGLAYKESAGSAATILGNVDEISRNNDVASEFARARRKWWHEGHNPSERALLSLVNVLAPPELVSRFTMKAKELVHRFRDDLELVRPFLPNSALTYSPQLRKRKFESICRALSLSMHDLQFPDVTKRLIEESVFGLIRRGDWLGALFIAFLIGLQFETFRHGQENFFDHWSVSSAYAFYLGGWIAQRIGNREWTEIAIRRLRGLVKESGPSSIRAMLCLIQAHHNHVFESENLERRSPYAKSALLAFTVETETAFGLTEVGEETAFGNVADEACILGANLSDWTFLDRNRTIDDLFRTAIETEQVGNFVNATTVRFKYAARLIEHDKLYEAHLMIESGREMVHANNLLMLRWNAELLEGQFAIRTERQDAEQHFERAIELCIANGDLHRVALVNRKWMADKLK